MDVVAVDAAGLFLIAWIAWYFLLSRRDEVGLAAEVAGVQALDVVVKGGYQPDVIQARPGLALRLRFHRQEDAACSEEIVFPDFGIRRHLRAFETTVIDLPASPAGIYPFACGMNMMHGRVQIGEAPMAENKTAPAAARPAQPAIDPICGMTVDPDLAAGSTERGGKTYHFCSRACKETFDTQEAPKTKA